MSEPMSSVEIEDVLSSIRRLVSDDMRPQLRGQDRAQPVAAPAADKLLLTPALRIVPEPDVAPVQEAPVEAAAVSDDVVFHSIRHDEAAFVAVEDEAALEALLLQQPVITDADAYDDDEAALPVEPSVTMPQDVFAAPQVDAADTPLDANWADEAEAAVRAELEQETTQAAYAKFLDEPEGAALDEDTMRELVRDIIREELQGTLGERITRNVRKLVRAEIARALAVRDFE
mgnify:CR=1 FL=1